MHWLKESPSYFRFRNGTIRLEEPEHGKLIGQKLNVRTGAFEPASDEDMDAVLRSGTDLDFSALNEEQFVKATEEARSLYLRGSGPVFDLYAQIKEMFEHAEQERRRISPEERSMIAALYRTTFQVWEEEFARRDAGDEPTFGYSWVGGSR
ncbi:hypothetical protein OHB26_06840 [Nocardia sp. NBC_01503]|uniref:hypothetical protein n=1 Tax=Nocardia sp. NBC_01503 TaxID=2975997 RepID=UPI002E7C0625|nr:hypothetical protein [Nocardia sp. NBC_01503]WTL33926.1 hypothetical protein OHB26_06840 [Nocardia sp. NBC_01503]